MTYQEYLKAIAEQVEINHRNSSSNSFICNAIISYHKSHQDSYPYFRGHEGRLRTAVMDMLYYLSAHGFYEYTTLTALGRYYAEIDNLDPDKPILSQLQARLRFLKELAEKA